VKAPAPRKTPSAGKTTGAKPKAKAKAKAKTYTAAQNASYQAWLKKIRAQEHAAHVAHVKHVQHLAHINKTLTLNSTHVIPEEDVKLGRNAPYAAADKPRLVLDNYLTSPATPSVVDFASQVVSWPMYGNDTIGDCTCATAGHQIQAWTCYTGAEVTVPQEDIIQLYSAVSGYNPATGANDNGANVQDVLTYWRKSGVPVAGHKILAFAQLQDLAKVKDALFTFGSVYLGINFPASAMDQFNADQSWTVVQGSQIEGGHAIPLQYAGTGAVPYQIVTWGKLQGMDQAFLDTYCEEAWVVITDDWLDKNGHDPEGLDLAQLGADLAAMTGDPNPFPSPAPAPGPAPAPSPAPSPAPAPAPQPAPSPVPGIVQDLERVGEIIVKDAPQIVAAVEKIL